MTTLSKAQARKLKGLVIWASTSSEHYSIKRIRPGATVAAAAARLHTVPSPRGCKAQSSFLTSLD